MSLECDSSYEGLIIRKNQLIQRKWIPAELDEETDEVIKEGFYQEENITDKLPYFLMSNCIIDENTTLRDFFKLLNQHREFLEVIQKRNWFTDWLNYGLNSPNITNSKVLENPDEPEMEYLEIYKSIHHTAEFKVQEDKVVEFSMMDSPDVKIRHKIHSVGDLIEEETYLSLDFHGLSTPITQRQIDNKSRGYYGCKAGERASFGFIADELPRFIDLPIKLKDELNIYVTKGEVHETITYRGFGSFRLIDIIEAIFYEISFYGSPTKAKEVSQEIHESVQKIKEGD